MHTGLQTDSQPQHARTRGLFALWGMVILNLTFTAAVVSCAATDPLGAELIARSSPSVEAPMSPPAGP